MIASTYLQAAQDMPSGFTLNRDTLKAIIDKHNSDNPASKAIGSWRREAVEVLILRMPRSVLQTWMEHYRQYTWESCFLNADLCRMKVWAVGVAQPRAYGPWADVYTNTAASVELLQKICISDWERLVPQSSLPMSRPEIQGARYSKEKLQQVSFRVLAYQHWLLDQVRATFGDAGVTQAARELELGNLNAELDLIVAARDAPEQHQVLTLYSMPQLHAVLSGKRDRLHSHETQLAETDVMQAKLEELTAGIAEETKQFEEVVAQTDGQKSATVLRLLCHARACADAGREAADDFAKFGIHVVPAGESEKAKLHLDAFLRHLQPEMMAGTSSAVPIFVLWNQNTGGAAVENPKVWTKIVDGIKSILHGHPQATLAAVVHKKTVGTVYRDQFLYEIQRGFHEAGLDFTTDLSLHYKVMHGGSRRSSAVTGRLGWTDLSMTEDHLFFHSALLRGDVDGLTPTMSEEVSLSSNAEYELVRTGAEHLGHNQRSQFISPDTYTKVFKKAFSKAATTLSGTATDGTDGHLPIRCTTTRGLPLAVLVVFDPYSTSVLDSFMEFKQADAKWQEGDQLLPDFRMILFPMTSEQQERLTKCTAEQVARAFTLGDIHINGHVAKPTLPSSAGTMASPHFHPKFGFVSPDGTFGVQAALLKPLLEHHVTSAATRALVESIQQKYQCATAPRLTPNEGGAAQSSEARMAVASDMICVLEKDVEPVPVRAWTDDEVPATVAALEALGPFLADIPSKNGKMRICLHADGRGFGVALVSHVTVAGESFLEIGSGGLREASQMEPTRASGRFAIEAVVSADNQEVLFQTDKQTSVKHTLYGLKAQLALDGYPDAVLNNHKLTRATPIASGGIERCPTSIYCRGSFGS